MRKSGPQPVPNGRDAGRKEEWLDTLPTIINTRPSNFRFPGQMPTGWDFPTRHHMEEFPPENDRLGRDMARMSLGDRSGSFSGENWKKPEDRDWYDVEVEEMRFASPIDDLSADYDRFRSNFDARRRWEDRDHRGSPKMWIGSERSSEDRRSSFDRYSPTPEDNQWFSEDRRSPDDRRDRHVERSPKFYRREGQRYFYPNDNWKYRENRYQNNWYQDRRRGSWQHQENRETRQETKPLSWAEEFKAAVDRADRRENSENRKWPEEEKIIHEPNSPHSRRRCFEENIEISSPSYDFQEAFDKLIDILFADIRVHERYAQLSEHLSQTSLYEACRREKYNNRELQKTLDSVIDFKKNNKMDQLAGNVIKRLRVMIRSELSPKVFVIWAEKIVRYANDY